MKLHNIFKSLFAVGVIAISSISCQEDVVKIDELRDQNDGHKVSVAEPTISGIYDYAAYMASDTPTPCIDAKMGQDLVIAGENLEGLTSITVMGIEILPADFYAEWDMVVMRIPYKLPASGAAPTLTCTTEFGSTDHSLELIIPDIEINNITNEFTKPGGRTYINGKFLSLCAFDTGESKIYIETEDGSYKQEVEIMIVSDDSVTVEIPADAPDNAYFTFEVNGEQLPRKFHYRPTGLLLFEGTNPENAGNWAEVSYTDGTADGDIENLITTPVGDNTELVKYIRIFGDIPKYKFVYSASYNINFAIEDGKTAGDYCFAYEVNTKEGHPIPLGNTYKLMVNNKPVNMWENYSKVVIDTHGEWVTQRVDFKEVAKQLKLDDPEAIERFDIKNMLALVDADHAFANFRIEPIIK